MTVPISVFIIALNEEARIGRTIESVSGFADEVIVVDSGSTDQTIAIAKDLGAQVHHKDWEGYGPQKSYAESLCKNKWILNIDADEVVTSALAAELTDLYSIGEPEPCVYDVRILTVYPGAEKPRPFANDYQVVRLYHLSVARYSTHPIYDRVQVNDGVELKHLSAPIYHMTFLNLYQLVEKGNAWSSHHVEGMANRSPVKLKLRLFLEMPWLFLKFYIFRGHIWGGSKGFVFALNGAFMRTMRVAKILEYQKSEKPDE